MAFGALHPCHSKSLSVAQGLRKGFRDDDDTRQWVRLKSFQIPFALDRVPLTLDSRSLASSTLAFSSGRRSRNSAYNSATGRANRTCQDVRGRRQDVLSLPHDAESLALGPRLRKVSPVLTQALQNETDSLLPGMGLPSVSFRRSTEWTISKHRQSQETDIHPEPRVLHHDTREWLPRRAHSRHRIHPVGRSAAPSGG